MNMQKIIISALVTMALFFCLPGANAQKRVAATANGQIVGMSDNGKRIVFEVALLPEIQQYELTGEPYVGLVNTVSYTYYDPQGRVEDHTEIEWFISDDAAGTNSQLVASGASYTVLSEHAGKYLCCALTPYADDGLGATVKGKKYLSTRRLIKDGFYENAFVGAGWRHMTFNVVNIDFGGEEVMAGDEIAVYDGEVCCAHLVLTGPVTEANQASYVSLAASHVDEGADGYTPGNAVSMRFWRKNSPAVDFQASLQFVDNTNTPVAAPVFAEHESAFVKITVTP